MSDTSNYLNVVLSKEYDFDPENLISFTFTDGKYYYTLTGSKDYLMKLKNSLLDKNEIIEITANFNS